jgi:hypothetical protein
MITSLLNVGLVLAIGCHTATLSMIASRDCVGAEVRGVLVLPSTTIAIDCKLLPIRDVSVRCNEDVETGSLCGVEELAVLISFRLLPA